jgi:UDP-glucose 4-epimerase
VEVGRFLRWHLNNRPIQIAGDLDRKTRDFIRISNLVQGFIVLAEKAELGEVYNVGSATELSMRQLLEVIGKSTGRTPCTEDTYRLVGDLGVFISRSRRD